MAEEKILIVENERIIARDLELMLKCMGWNNCIMAFSGQQALDMARKHLPDLMLVDIRLGKGIDGIELAEKIATFADIPVIYLTAYADADILKRARVTRPYGYIIKPIEERNILATLEMAFYRFHTEKKLKEKDKWLQLIIENLDEGLLAVDAEGNIQMMNRAAEIITGRTAADALQNSLQNVLPLVHEYSGEPLQLPCKAAMDNADTIHLQEGARLKTPQAKTLSIEGKCVPIADEKGCISGTITVFNDVTQRIQLERQLRQSQKMEALGTLAGGIAHDFNNILSVILGYADLSLKKMSPDDKAYHCIEHVLTASIRAKELVKQILTFSRQGEEKRHPVQLSLIVNEVLKLLRSSLPSTIEIITDIRAHRSMVKGDPTQLHQVIINLCTNAAHAMKARGGKLKVILDEETVTNEDIAEKPHFRKIKPGRYVSIAIRDTGCGMNDEVMARIFEPYYTTKNAEEGTGMGLAMVHGIVECYNGTIHVHSTPGKGTTFKVYLPGISGETPEEMPAPQPIIGGKEHILFVDDDLPLVDIGREMLEQLGYVVVGRTSSIKALENFRREPDKYDLVITDLTMPHMTGIQLARLLQTIRADIPIILCTGFSNTLTTNEANEIGIKEVVMKPLVQETIAAAIRRCLD
jgi:two-component system, cell cycle sensor histidine kinase and response regulator CckA